MNIDETRRNGQPPALFAVLENLLILLLLLIRASFLVCAYASASFGPPVVRFAPQIQ